jgi:hypothetical protein
VIKTNKINSQLKYGDKSQLDPTEDNREHSELLTWILFLVSDICFHLRRLEDGDREGRENFGNSAYICDAILSRGNRIHISSEPP